MHRCDCCVPAVLVRHIGFPLWSSSMGDGQQSQLGDVFSFATSGARHQQPLLSKRRLGNEALLRLFATSRIHDRCNWIVVPPPRGSFVLPYPNHVEVIWLCGHIVDPTWSLSGMDCNDTGRG